MAKSSAACEGIMNAAEPAVEVGGVEPPATIRVWDPFVRVFHWSLVMLFVIAYATGDEIERVHIYAGYTIAVLIALRVLWGLIGSRHARFTDFVRSPREIIAYLRAVARWEAPHYIGHNPAGGLMILLLLGTLAVTCATGLAMTTDAFWGAKWVEEVHETCANLTVGLVLFHILGAVTTSLMHGENLVKAMVTGRKRVGMDDDNRQ
jgi:cytochrome b